jgi:hypothetical protein|tara:strand:- start:8701 stop:8946 length:246 start_codon:yes stop_codon:yes gene_type:complete
MFMAIRRGAPFDENNFFNIPPIDGGDINQASYVAVKISNIEGGAIAAGPASYFDGGLIPTLGTASFDPSITYGPNSPLIGD